MQTASELRRAKDDFLKNGHDSPLTDEQRASFGGLRYFEEDPAYRVVATFERGTGERAEVQMSDGSTSDMERAGTLSFTIGGRSLRLAAFAQDAHTLFVPFRDDTSGLETYGAGRYVECERRPDGAYELDFNRAYNPYCAYNERWRCPLPPAENRLMMAIRAGEKEFQH